jgi:hypothetical protein
VRRLRRLDPAMMASIAVREMATVGPKLAVLFLFIGSSVAGAALGPRDVALAVVVIGAVVVALAGYAFFISAGSHGRR